MSLLDSIEMIRNLEVPRGDFQLVATNELWAHSGPRDGLGIVVASGKK